MSDYSGEPIGSGSFWQLYRKSSPPSKSGFKERKTPIFLSRSSSSLPLILSLTILLSIEACTWFTCYHDPRTKLKRCFTYGVRIDLDSYNQTKSNKTCNNFNVSLAQQNWKVYKIHSEANTRLTCVDLIGKSWPQSLLKCSFNNLLESYSLIFFRAVAS